MHRVDRGSQNVVGLAKLLLLEKLTTPEARFKYKERHRAKQLRRRNRNNNNLRYIKVGWGRRWWVCARTCSRASPCGRVPVGVNVRC